MATTKSKTIDTAKPVATAKKTTTKKKAASIGDISGDQVLYEAIQQTAYFIAEKNSFSGDAVSYWLEAEAQIKNAL